MNIEQEKMIVESLSSLYPLQEFEEKAIHTVLDALPSAQPEPCEDAVSRKAVIDLLAELTANGTNKGMIRGDDAVHRVEILPPVTPKGEVMHGTFKEL